MMTCARAFFFEALSCGFKCVSIDQAVAMHKWALQYSKTSGGGGHSKGFVDGKEAQEIKLGLKVSRSLEGAASLSFGVTQPIPIYCVGVLVIASSSVINRVLKKSNDLQWMMEWRSCREHSYFSLRVKRDV